MPELDLLNADPGDVVVPLADVLELLQSALNNEELNDLSSLLISRRITNVQSGDVISAQLMNQVLSDIENLQARVTELENGIPSQAAPRIFFVEPNDGVRIGETLEVVGSNLAPNSLTRVRIGNREVTAYNGSSQGKLLSFSVPPMIGIPGAGAEVSLLVENEFGSDTIMVNVLPSVANDLTANLTLGFTDFPDQELEPDTEYAITARLSAITSIDAEYDITALLSGGSDWSVAVEGSDTIFIPESRNGAFVTDIELLVTTGASGSATLTVSVVATEHPDQNRSSTPLPLAIGAAPEVNTDVVLSAQNIPPTNFDLPSNTFLVGTGETVPFLLQFGLAFYPQDDGESDEDFAAKNTYTFDAPTINPPGPWSLNHPLPQTVIADSPGELASLAFQLSLTTGTSSASELQFLVSRNGSTEPPFELIYTLTNT